MKFQPWHVIVATVTASAVVVSGMGYLAYDTIRGAQEETIASYEQAIIEGNQHISQVKLRISDLELAISNGEHILESSQGKTLDEAARTELVDELADAELTLAEEKQELENLHSVVDEVESVNFDGFFWPSDFSENREVLDEIAQVDVVDIIEQVQEIGQHITAVQDAQQLWQAEQDRIAAEKAAAEAAAAQAAAARAAARNAAATSSLSETGGGTAPSAPAPPATPLPQVQGFNVESYVAALAPNSIIEWIPDLCVQYYVCGRAWVGGTTSTPVIIQLDSNKRDIYANQIGISVLVHEAAHARQWATYGGNILTESLSQAPQFAVPATSTDEEKLAAGKRAVEYMADCATIGKLNYSTGAYTNSCTGDQISRISGIWPRP